MSTSNSQEIRIWFIGVPPTILFEPNLAPRHRNFVCWFIFALTAIPSKCYYVLRLVYYKIRLTCQKAS